MMIKLIIGLIVAGLIAGGVYYYTVYDSGSKSAGKAGSQIQTTIEGAKGAVQQTEDLQNKINSEAQKQQNQSGY